MWEESVGEVAVKMLTLENSQQERGIDSVVVSRG